MIPMRNKKFWEIRNSAEDSDTVDLMFYGDIESDGRYIPGNNSSTSFAEDLDACEGKNINLRINSPGGNVFEAQAIYNLLKAYKGKVTAHIDGLCASAATVVACAAESIIMPANSLFMIHNPACYIDEVAEADELRKTADMLDNTKSAIVNVYLARTKGKLTEEEIRSMMDGETWMTSDEALKKGFVDEVDNFGVDATLDKGVVVVNGISMPHIKERQEELVKMMTGKKQVSNVEKNEEKNDVLNQIKDVLAKLGITASAPKASEPQAATKTAVEDREETRIQALNALKGDNPFVNALVEAAVENGSTAESIKNFVDAVKAVPQAKEKTTVTVDEIKKLITDQLQSGAEGVGAAPQGGAADNASKTKAAVDEIVAIVNEARK